MARLIHPPDARKQDRSADDQATPIHVVDGGDCDGHVQWTEIHGDDNQRPADRDYVDEIAPFSEVEVWVRWED